MKNRYKMNRIGFVNFWLYDEEDFEFVDGKLLLRGQNGSGKSITTQSFIPFVLDGDRTPSRLDPFGSSDRRMEYYFLGEEGRDEATGYLFLEFKKEHSEEYRTIGIGQRAKRGKPMDFWGFIILDGRRIGHDLWLYKEVGSTKIPYDKREMKNELGEGNVFTDSQSEYKRLVNQHIFGFKKAEQYEQFIKLLVKVRAPKLSKEFKPTKVYEILNDSLQTLTDEDLRAMVDAMEKMDEIQDSLEMLNRAFDDVKKIRTEYTRYNQYMLAKKAQGYLSKRQEVEKIQHQLDEQEQLRREIIEEQQEKTHTKEALQERRILAEAERNGLLDTDMEEVDRKLKLAKDEKAQAEEQEKRWEQKIDEYKEKIRRAEYRLNEVKASLEERQDKLQRQKRELIDKQEVLQWSEHEKAIRLVGVERYENTDEITDSLAGFKKTIEECKKEIGQFEEISRQYDEIARQLEQVSKQKKLKEQELQLAEGKVTECRDQWILHLYELAGFSKEWHPEQVVLQSAEELLGQYRSVSDAGEVQELLRVDYERQRQNLADKHLAKQHEKKLHEADLGMVKEELAFVQGQKELEPAREEMVENSRKALQKAGIAGVPFYKTVEFAKELDANACARLEAQLKKMGILDALVVSSEDFVRISKECPEFLDTILYVKSEGTSDFSKLIVNEELDEALQNTVKRILSHIHEEPGQDQGIYVGEGGQFYQGILAGKADGTGEAEYVGQLARKRKKEQRISELQNRIQELTEVIKDVCVEIVQVEARLKVLNEEYRQVPGFTQLDDALAEEKKCDLELQMINHTYAEQEQQERTYGQRKNQQYQRMLQCCKVFPYGRTRKEYEAVISTLEEYQSIWQAIRENLLKIESDRYHCNTAEERIIEDEQAMDDAFVEKRRYSTSIKQFVTQIRQFEEYLNRPENVEKARRLSELNRELSEIAKEWDACRDSLTRLDERMKGLLETEPKQKEILIRTIAEETCLRNYFEEELSLKLVFDREALTIGDSAKKALTVLRDSDKTREASEILNSLYQVYQKYNGSLANYGTSLEECFGQVEEAVQSGEGVNALRQRVRVVSVWNGKKVYLEEFYQILKSAIDETELLIQKKDRELFEDILSQTISQQLTDRIAESRKWVEDMSKLMKEIDTSMGLSFSLDWKPRTAENDAELDTAELEQILLRDRNLLSVEDIEKVAFHFRSKIRSEKMKLEDNGGFINYMELVRDALDYRKWFEFQMYYRHGEEARKPLTDRAFNRFSGGEKAMAMYVPLFAAVNAQYKKASYEDHPRMIALDEAFAGVDDKNISSMFELVHKLDFDYIMNSQALWGCYETVRGIRIAELHRPMNSQIVAIIRYTWNGHERILDVQ